MTSNGELLHNVNQSARGRHFANSKDISQLAAYQCCIVDGHGNLRSMSARKWKKRFYVGALTKSHCLSLGYGPAVLHPVGDLYPRGSSDLQKPVNDSTGHPRLYYQKSTDFYVLLVAFSFYPRVLDFLLSFSLQKLRKLAMALATQASASSVVSDWESQGASTKTKKKHS